MSSSKGRSSKGGGGRGGGGGGDKKKDEDEVKFKLSNNRFASVGEFRNKMRVDIREYYINDDGEKKPGKKGISLSAEEWKTLKDHMEDIDKAMKSQSSDASDSD
jgi:hypothetical protein